MTDFADSLTLLAVNRFLLIVLMFSFFSSIAVGEEACCSIFEDSGFSSSIDNSMAESGDADLHFCEEGTDSSNSHGDHFHFCVGCSHVPFLQTQTFTLGDYSMLTNPLSSKYHFFITSLYIDGPFQPPKA